MTRDANGTNLNGHNGAPLHLLPTYHVQTKANGMTRDVNGKIRDARTTRDVNGKNRDANGTNQTGAPLHPLLAYHALPEIP